MTIELRHLRYFLAVAEEGHVTRAAARLGLQQPPLSQQIRSLESELGTPLFLRRPRGMRLTRAGEALLDDTRAILARLDQAVARVRRTAAGEEGRLAIGFTGSASFHRLVPQTIRAFRQSAPSVSLALEESSTAELVTAILEERLDAAFIRSPAGEAPGLAIEKLLDEEMLVAMPVGHPLAGRGRRTPLAALASETLILYRRPTGPGLYDAIITACHAAGFSPVIGQEAPRMLSTLSLVAAGLGISIVPASMRRLDTRSVAYVRLTKQTRLTAPLSLATRRDDRSAAVHHFIERARAVAEESRERRR